MGVTLPAELRLGDLVLRRPDPDQAGGVVEAVNESLGDLGPWMAWAQQPAELEATAMRLALAGAAFELAGDASWTIFDCASDQVIGSCGLHQRMRPGGRDIGYWVRSGWTGRGVASRAAAALTCVGFETLELERVEIRCDEANERSAAVARRLGFEHLATVESFCGAPRDSGRTMVWAMGRAAWPSVAPAETSPLRR